MRKCTSRELVMAGVIALSLFWAGPSTALAPAPPALFPNVVSAVRSTPGCLGVETGQTSNGRQVIFAWFESKKALLGWYRSDVHQRAMRAVFPNQSFDREPLPDLAEDSGPILAIVSEKLADGAGPGGPSMPISSIGIELYGPLPGGVAVGGRFAPESIKVRGLREIDLGTAQAQPR